MSADQRLGSVFRAVRVRKLWRQTDVARKAGVSAGVVSLLERGHLDSLSIRTLRKISAALDVRIDFVARWRGGELDRLLNARHSTVQGAAARLMRNLPDWFVAPEVSFAIGTERGWIDLLAWHAPSRTLLVIEVKTEIVDIQELIGTVDRKVRLAPRVARERGWQPIVIASWLIVAEGSTNRRRIAAHADLLRAAFPTDARTMRHWLRRPIGKVAALTFMPYSNTGNAKLRMPGPQRVRRFPRAAT